jgi:N-acetylmuramoyl-L-alanine amidase
VPLPAPPAPPAPPVVLKAELPPVNPALPPVPEVNGPLEIKVVYPPAGQTISSRDSNFVFGSIGNGQAGLTINGVLTPVWPNGAFMAWLQNPPDSAPRYDIVATTGIDTARLAHPIKLLPPPDTVAPPPPDTVAVISPARWASLIGPAAYASDTDRVVTGYALTGGIQRWFLIPDTKVQVVGTLGADAHVRLDSLQTIRIAQADLQMLDSTTARVPLRARSFTVRNTAEWTDVVIPINGRPAFLVEHTPTQLTLTLYGATGARRQVRTTGLASSYLKGITALRSAPQMKYTFDMRGPVYGYQPLWEEGKFTFRVRKPPAIDSLSPLKGLTIAVDPGHPPIGATGPTGMWEPEATLPIGFKTQELLQAKGVNVIMTRTTPDPVALNLRPTIARRADAHAFVSIHLNAVPDGTNPFRAQGTATYHYYPHSGPLAETIQRAAVQHLSLPDNGVKRENFAVVRGTWMPSVLVEGAFIILPDQEAALRTPEYQARYAQSIVDGLEAYFRELAKR